MIDSEGWSWQLFERPDGTRVLEVLCDGPSLDTVRLTLDAEDEERYSSWGRYYVHSLALKVARDPQKYSARFERRF